MIFNVFHSLVLNFLLKTLLKCFVNYFIYLFCFRNACNLSCSVADDDIGLQCLTILEMVMGYTIFPSDPLPQFVFTLCRTVNIAPYCRASWKVSGEFILQCYQNSGTMLWAIK